MALLFRARLPNSDSLCSTGRGERMDDNAKRALKLKLLGIVIGIVIVVPIVAWKLGLL